MRTDIVFEVPDIIIEETLLEQAREQAIEEQGNFQLTTSVRAVRTVIPHRFYEQFPDAFYKLATIPVRKAEEAVGKARLADCIQTTETETVKVEYIRLRQTP